MSLPLRRWGHVGRYPCPVALPHLSDRIGRVLGERYRLIAPIGSGASASVYLGEDLTLRRQVAVKVLHPALADDEAFLRRFRAEAQTAASLADPHVLSVHDWGHDGDTPYLVSEYLAGGSLRSVLDATPTLSPSQVLVVGLQAARGLAYAHRRQLVHRDIKPANLLFDDEERLRIADFGLARALAEAAWTEPMGAMLGTARYASPEQARGEPLDGRSDVYSLALVLVEATTGEVPFAGDTTLGTLMARVDAPLVVPDELGPLAPILAAAGHPDRTTRMDADTFAAALLAAAPSMDRPQPLPLVRVADLSAPDLSAPELTPNGSRSDGGPAELPIGDGDSPLLSGGGFPDPVGTGVSDLDVNGDTDLGVMARGEPPVGPGPAGGPPDTAGDSVDPPQPRRPGRRRLVALGVVVAVLLTGLGAAWWTQARDTAVEVPALVGLAVAVAERTADDNGWVLERNEQFHPTIDPGLVVSQSPEAGDRLEPGEVLAVAVSIGPAPVPLPDGVVGVPFADAEARLAEVGLAAGTVTEQFDEDVPAGVVLSAGVEPGVEVPFGDPVDLVVSAGPEPRRVPDNLVGRALDEVRNLLSALGLPVQVGGESFSDDVPAGAVIASEPTPGAVVDRGTPVRVDVSLGPPVVTIPNVAGLSVVDAAAQLEAAGLDVGSTTGSPTRPVTGTTPAAGEVVRLGSSVTLSTR